MMPACIVARSPSGGSVPPYGAPVAHWEASSTDVRPFDTVYFYDTSTGIPTSWEWHLDSPTGPLFSIDRNPNYTFNANGVFYVFLIARNIYGESFYGSVIFVDNGA